MRGGLLAWVAVSLMIGGCGEDARPPVGGRGDAERGRIVYLAQCVACHNPDPSKPGSLGPPVKGSPRDLLEARLILGTYPPGHKPKRESSVMQPMPHLVAALPDLEAFLK